jgi:hypothetical protein
MNSRSAMLWGLALLFPNVALVVTTQVFGSMSILLVGTAASAASTALEYRGSLGVVNNMAPQDRCAEVER